MSRAAVTDPVVVLAADDSFAMPLAVTVRSAVDNLAPERSLEVYVLDGGIRRQTRVQIRRSWPQNRVRVEWIEVDEGALAGVPVSGHINRLTYFRVLSSRLLPAAVQRAIYLDSDLVVRADLARLWDEPLAGAWCLAAQDCAAPYLDLAASLPNYERCRPYLNANPIPNYRELGLQPTAPYFNAGVLLMDLAAWRAHDLPGQMLACLEHNRQHVVWWDQYALNVVLAGRWRAVDRRWNQGSQIFGYPDWQQSPLDQESFEQLRNDPWIIHYNSKSKPWRAKCRHPLRQEFVTYLDRTAWAGQRPPLGERLIALLDRQERRLRQGRKWLARQARGWLRAGQE